jgi:hypothetical protein
VEGVYEGYRDGRRVRSMVKTTTVETDKYTTEAGSDQPKPTEHYVGLEELEVIAYLDWAEPHRPLGSLQATRLARPTTTALTHQGESMRTVTLILALLLVPLAAAQRTVVNGEIYEIYSNGRFGFSVN